MKRIGFTASEEVISHFFQKIRIKWAVLHEDLLLGFLTRSDINRAVQPQKMARGLKFWIQELEGLYYVVKTKAIISCVLTVQLSWVFLSPMQKAGVF